jgi:hypothetical protein
MSNPQQLVQKLWNYCNILPSSLRYDATSSDDGLPFRLRGATARRDGDYVEQLIPPSRDCCLKMADEQAKNYIRACGQGGQTVIAALPDISRFLRKAVGLHVDQIRSSPLKSGVYAESAHSGIRCGFVSMYFQILLITGALT